MSQMRFESELEGMMRVAVLLTFLFGLVSQTLSADTRVIILNHTDGFAVGDQEVPPKDLEYVYWIGENRLQVDQGSHSHIVRPDMGVMLFVDHVDRSYFVLELPIVREELIPPDFDRQTLEMTEFNTRITPSGASKQFGDWRAQGYEVVMTSPSIALTYTEWATEDVPFDNSAMASMYGEVVKLVFLTGNYHEESEKIGGFTIAGEGQMSMPTIGVEGIGLKWFTKQIDELSPPEGTYIPPRGYVKKPFDFLAMFQRMQ